MGGINCSPFYICKDENNNISMKFRTLFMQEMINSGVLFTNFLSICYRHKAKELKKTQIALNKTMKIYKKALEHGINRYLKGNPIKPVFRKFN